ncbi:MAG: right-handed parallel beta-helix repeat-containing protein [Pirellulaceae bacterium]|nr:right-handed parallel beta-helix repeat-containing protein [Pirellulaceae bacterium]
MNRRLVLGLVAALVAGVFFLARLPHAATQQAETTLPGARPAVDALRFPSLQAALDALPAEGGLVRLPAGTFEIHEPLRISGGDVCLEGAGTATLIRNLNTQGQPALVLAHPMNEDARRDRQHALWRIRLANFRLVGNPQSGHGVEARQVNEILIDGLTVSEHGGDGIRLDHCYEDPRVCDSLITYNRGVGLNLLGCHDIVVSANQFEENQDALHCLDGYNLTMTGNAVDDHLGRGVLIENTYGSVVTGNMIEECAGAAIVLDRDCYGITLSANVIAHNGSGIELRDAHGCAVSANTLTLMKTHALWIGPQSGRIAVGGNSFCNSYIGEGSVRRSANDLEAGGLVLDSTRDVAVTGNTFTSVRPKAVTLNGENHRIVFQGNLLVDTASDHDQLTGGIVTGNLESE